MVEREEWGRGDDRRMLKALWTGECSEEWEVSFGSLVEGRTERQVRQDGGGGTLETGGEGP